MISEEELKNTNDSELIMLYRENDEDAKNLLFYKYKYIIDILINKYMRFLTNLNIDHQELISECNVGFSDGLKCFDESKDASLVTFVTLCIERRLKGIIRKYNRDKYKTLQEAYSLDFIYDDNNSKLMDSISDNFSNDPLKNMAEEEKYQELIKSLKISLTKREYEVFSLMANGFNYIEIADILKLTPKQVDNTRERVKLKVKKILKKEDD